MRGHDLPYVEGEVPYSSEGGNPLDHEGVADHDHPTADPLLVEGVELSYVGDLMGEEDLLPLVLVVPSDAGDPVAEVPPDAPSTKRNYS